MYTNMTTNLMVESVDKAINFYRDILDFTVLVSVPDENDLQFAILSKDGLSLMLEKRSVLIGEYPVLNTEKVRPSVSLYIMVDNFMELYEELKSRHPIYVELHTSPYGAKEFALTDVDGYVLTFTENKDI